MKVTQARPFDRADVNKYIGPPIAKMKSGDVLLLENTNMV